MVGKQELTERFESWFAARRRVKAIEMIELLTKIATNCVDEMTRCIQAASDGKTTETKAAFGRLRSKEREGDNLRKSIIDELARANLPGYERTSLMRIARQIDWIADWSLESTNILTQFNYERMPEGVRKIVSEMSRAVKDCAVNVEDCIRKLTAKQIRASLDAADAVERFEEEVDNLHINARGEVSKINDPSLGMGAVVLLVFFLEALENVSDRCEDTCDQARVIAVLHSQS